MTCRPCASARTKRFTSPAPGVKLGRCSGMQPGEFYAPCAAAVAGVIGRWPSHRLSQQSLRYSGAGETVRVARAVRVNRALTLRADALGLLCGCGVLSPAWD